MDEWIAIAIAIIGPIILHVVREGYVRRQLEDIEARLDNSMAREVVEEKVKGLNMKMDNEQSILTKHIADDAKVFDRIEEKLEAVRKSVHDLREDVPNWLDQAADRAIKAMKGLG